MRFILILFFSVLSLSIFSQFDIQGTVKNEQGEALEGATVFLRDSEFATVTDKQGQWILRNVPSGFYELKASFLGFKSFEENFNVIDDYVFDIVLEGGVFQIDEISIKANQVKDEDPFSYTDISKEELAKTNLGQDVPFLLQHTTSAVVTSDAGAGIGYTGIRIRGTDATRINVTINGIPLNDSESQGVFWVNLPDLSSSAHSMQIQRGVGTSTNGSGAFGGTLGINTDQLYIRPYAQFDATVGSFNTLKYSVQAGTGVMNNKFAIDLRYSNIQSDGYIDRASSDLSSWFLSATSIGNKSMLRLNAFSGHEVTYQAWYGSPIEKVNGDQEALMNHYQNNPGLYPTEADSINLFDSDRKYNYYLQDNVEDNYTQSHYQLIYDKELQDNLLFNGVLHYTKGFGYFEQYRYEDELEFYGISPQIVFNEETSLNDTIYESDLRRRRWLDNDFVGAVLSLEKENENSILTLGGAIHYYRGDHFGRVIWSEATDTVKVLNDYYFNLGEKLDYNGFVKLKQKVNDKFSLFGDLQLRGINYSVLGDDNDLAQLNIDTSMLFFNPKLGVNFALSDSLSFYASAAVANREPDRNDFVSAHINNQSLKHESLLDIELGTRSTFKKLSLSANAYYMKYKNQLVLSGELDDVGSSLRVNVPDSYRMGVELSAIYQPTSKLIWKPNLTLSRNKIKEFNQILYDYTGGGFGIITQQFTNSDISFSPTVISGSRLTYLPKENFEIEWLSKYVSRQYLDNTGDVTKSLDAYFVNDLRLSYNFDISFAREARISLLVNNVFNNLYSANGYTYSYIYDQTITERYLYPQAVTNFLLSFKLRFD